MKKIFALILALVMLLTIASNFAFAQSNSGFTYGIYSSKDNTIKITGYMGDLRPGQNLVIPSEINGRKVVAISGYYGAKGGNFGTFTLPDTLQYIENLHVLGFTGTLVIPKSVTQIAQPDGLYFSGIKELVFNATMEMYEQKAWIDYDNTALEKIVIGDGIKYFDAPFLFSSSNVPNLKTVEVPDSVQYISAEGSHATFYLKRFDTTIHKIGPVSYGGGTIYKPLDTGVKTSERGLAIGLKSCKYYYTNTGEDFPVEQLFITSKEGFTTFLEDDANSSWGKKSYPGLYAGWNGTIKVNTSPVNATGATTPKWSSSNTSVATVKDGVVTAVDIGSTTIRATLGSDIVEVPIVVRGLYVISSDNGVVADNLAGNIELPTENINANQSISLQLEADNLNNWAQWDQLKGNLEDVYKKVLECSEVFDIKVSLKNGTSVWKVQPIKGKKISIWMPVENIANISKQHLVHVKDDGSYEEINFTYSPNSGVPGIRFETESFSSFALIEETDTPIQPSNGSPNPGAKPTDSTKKPSTSPTNSAEKPNTIPTNSAEKPNPSPTNSTANPNTTPTNSAEKPNATPTNSATKPNATPTNSATKPNATPTNSTEMLATDSSDSTISNNNGSEPVETPTESTLSETQNTEPETEPSNSEKNGGIPWWILVIVVMVSLAGGAISGIIIYKKKK